MPFLTPPPPMPWFTSSSWGFQVTSRALSVKIWGPVTSALLEGGWVGGGPARALPIRQPLALGAAPMLRNAGLLQGPPCVADLHLFFRGMPRPLPHVRYDLQKGWPVSQWCCITPCGQWARHSVPTQPLDTGGRGIAAPGPGERPHPERLVSCTVHANSRSRTISSIWGGGGLAAGGAGIPSPLQTPQPTPRGNSSFVDAGSPRQASGSQCTATPITLCGHPVTQYSHSFRSLSTATPRGGKEPMKMFADGEMVHGSSPPTRVDPNCSERMPSAPETYF